jgi:hypothetical protein
MPALIAFISMLFILLAFAIVLPLIVWRVARAHRQAGSIPTR